MTRSYTRTYDDWDAYEAYLAELEQDAQRSRERRNQPLPLKWGDKMSESGYFCEPCWRQGFETGEHPYDTPPCDSLPRGPYDPR